MRPTYRIHKSILSNHSPILFLLFLANQRRWEFKNRQKSWARIKEFAWLERLKLLTSWLVAISNQLWAYLPNVICCCCFFVARLLVAIQTLSEFQRARSPSHSEPITVAFSRPNLGATDWVILSMQKDWTRWINDLFSAATSPKCKKVKKTKCN